MKLRLQIYVVSLISALALGLVGLGASPAAASATGCQTISGFGFTYQGVTFKIPLSALCHTITGSGRSVTNEYAWFQIGGGLGSVPSARVCNWRIDFRYRDNNGVWYRTNRGPTHTTCDWFWNVTRNSTTDFTARYGIGCAALYVNGSYRGQQCHSIVA